MPFQVLGNPELKNMPFQFTPVAIKGFSIHPPLENKLCYGVDLRSVPVERKLNLSYLFKFYHAFPDKEKFFTNYFEKLVGNKELREQIKKGMTEDQIRATWKSDLDSYKEKRKKYLLYK